MRPQNLPFSISKRTLKVLLLSSGCVFASSLLEPILDQFSCAQKSCSHHWWEARFQILSFSLQPGAYFCEVVLSGVLRTLHPFWHSRLRGVAKKKLDDTSSARVSFFQKSGPNHSREASLSFRSACALPKIHLQIFRSKVVFPPGVLATLASFLSNV